MAGPSNTQFAVAIHVLTMLGGLPGTPVSSETMAGSVAANPVYLRRVLGQLRAAGFVDSRPGPRGGWLLMKEPSEITLGDAWRAVQPEAQIFATHHVNPSCPVGSSMSATLEALDQSLAASVVAQLDETTVEQVMPDLSAVSAEELGPLGLTPEAAA